MEAEMNYERLCDILESKFMPGITKLILNVYMFGSRVYGTNSADSDWDFYAITSKPISDQPTSEFHFPSHQRIFVQYDDGLVNVSFLPISDFITMLREHRHDALECYFAAPEHVWKKTIDIPFQLDPDVLKRTVYWESTNRLGNAQNKYKANQFSIAKKFLFHSLRYLKNAIQIMKTGRIYDIKSANAYFHELFAHKNIDHERWKTEHKLLKEEFKNCGFYRHFYYKHETWRNTLTIIGNKRIVADLATNECKYEESKSFLVNYLRKNGFKSFSEKFPVFIRHHSKYKNLLQFTCKPSYGYTEWEGEERNIMSECSGIILDSENNWSPVCFSFSKLFNYNEPLAPSIDFDSARIFEKLDGFKCVLYHYNDEWHLSYHWEADSPQGVINWKDPIELVPHNTLNECFWQAWKELGYNLPSNKEICYTFNYLSSYIRYSIPHPKDNIVLISARNLNSFNELDSVTIAKENNWAHAKEFSPLSNLDSIVDLSNTLHPYEYTGFVVCDKNFSRIKVKNFEHVAMTSNMVLGSPYPPMVLTPDLDERQLLELVRTDASEFLAYYVNKYPMLAGMVEDYRIFCEKVQTAFNVVKDLTDIKEIGMHAGKFYFGYLFFSLRLAQMTDIRELFYSYDSKKYSIILNKLNYRNPNANKIRRL